MLQSLGLRPKLLIIMVGGAVLLAMTLTVITIYTLLNARNQALDAAAGGLKDQGHSFLDLLVERSSTLSTERLIDAAEAGQVAAQALLLEDSQQFISAEYAAAVQLTRQADGSWIDTRPNQITTVYVPPEMNASIETIKRDIRDSAVLDAIFPQQSLNSRNIIAIAYVGPSGLIRLFPPEVPTNRDFTRELQLLEQFRQGDQPQIWLKPFSNLDIIRHVGIVTAVAIPVYKDSEFRGLIITYVSLSQIARDLDSLSPTSQSFAFLIDSDKTLISAPPQALPFLINQQAQPLREPKQITRTASAELDRVIESMTQGSTNVELITIDGRPYFAAYDRISANSWSLGLLVPVDEVTNQAAEVSHVIRNTTQQALLWISAAAVVFALLALLISLYLSGRLTRPLTDLAKAAGAIGRGEYDQQVAISSGDELGQVAAAFNTMSQSVLRARQQLQEQNRQLEEVVQSRTAALQSTVAQLEESLSRQETLYELLRAVSTPVIPLAEGVLLLPLIGTLDEQRAQQALQLLLRSIETQRARTVILDVTGLPVIDTAVAGTLLRAAQAARLLGAETILAGIRPEVAETLVVLGVGLDELHPAADLQAALAQALQRVQRIAGKNGA